MPSIQEQLNDQANAVAKARILARGDTLDPEGDRLAEIYEEISRQFEGVSLIGMLKVLSSYVVDQAFFQSATHSGGIRKARDLARAFEDLAQEYCRLKIKNFRAQPMSRDAIKAELEGALKGMRENTEYGAGGLLEAVEAALAEG